MYTYFAKYFHSEDKRIFKGTKCFYGETIVTCRSDEAGLIWQQEPNLYIPIKLFLCSTDIKANNVLTSIERGIDFIPDDAQIHFLDRKVWFKIIGEISSNARWVREGNEYDSDDLEPLLYYKKHPNESVYLDDMKQLAEWMKLNPNPVKYKVIINIKCPHCGNFN